MPEGHTLHTLARDLQRDLAGAVVRVSSPQGRFLAAEAVDLATLARAEAVGKHLLLHFTSGTVHVHLGLFGRTYRRKHPAPERASVRLRLEGAAYTWDIVGPTCCELLDIASVALLRARLGADPLDPNANPDLAWLASSSSAGVRSMFASTVSLRAPERADASSRDARPRKHARPSDPDGRT